MFLRCQGDARKKEKEFIDPKQDASTIFFLQMPATLGAIWAPETIPPAGFYVFLPLSFFVLKLFVFSADSVSLRENLLSFLICVYLPKSAGIFFYYSLSFYFNLNSLFFQHNFYGQFFMVYFKVLFFITFFVNVYPFNALHFLAKF